MPGRTQITPERLALVQECISQGWPLVEIYRTHRVTRKTIRRHFPQYHGMPRTEAASLGAAARRLALRNQPHA